MTVGILPDAVEIRRVRVRIVCPPIHLAGLALLPHCSLQAQRFVPTCAAVSLNGWAC